MRKALRDFYNWYIIILAVVSLTPILAPVAAKIGESNGLVNSIAKFIYLVYSFTCHQLDFRSFHLLDYQYAWCARDTGIWAAITLTAIWVKYTRSRGIRFYWMIPFIIPMALDGGIQTVATLVGLGSPTGEYLYISTNMMRFLTGAIFGMGVSLWLSPLLLESLNEISLKVRFRAKQLGLFLLITAVGYFALISIWRVTSSRHLPSDALDSAVKMPKTATEVFQRRAHGLCPAGADSFIQLDCEPERSW